MKGYEGLLEGELPNIIKWCVDNDFIQQALTFTAEEMPGYFWKSGLFKASVSEKEKYDKFLMAKRSPNKKNNKSCIKQYSKIHPSTHTSG